MKLSEEIKLEIKKEFEDFKHKMYDGKTLEERKKLDQFFTPPQVSIPLLENLETVKDIDILDQIKLAMKCNRPYIEIA